MSLRKLIASFGKFWTDSRTKDDGERGRMIIERLLEMSKRPPVGESCGAAGAEDRPERKGA